MTKVFPMSSGFFGLREHSFFMCIFLVVGPVPVLYEHKYGHQVVLFRVLLSRIPIISDLDVSYM